MQEDNDDVYRLICVKTTFSAFFRLQTKFDDLSRVVVVLRLIANVSV